MLAKKSEWSIKRQMNVQYLCVVVMTTHYMESVPTSVTGSLYSVQQTVLSYK